MSKFLELGKEVASIIISGYKDSYFSYVDVNDIPDKKLEDIGKALYKNKPMFDDYQRFLYESEDAFDWYASEVNSYDYIYNLVEGTIASLDNFHWNDESEQYIKRINIPTNTDVREFLSSIEAVYMIPKIIVLNEELNDYIVFFSSASQEYVCIEHMNPSLDFSSADCIGVEDFVEEIASLIESYNEFNSELSRVDSKSIACKSWDYISIDSSVKDVNLFFTHLDNIKLKESFINKLSEKISDLTEESEISRDSLRKNLVMYENGMLESIDESEYEFILKLANDVISIVLKDYFVWSSKLESWIERNTINEFKTEVESRLNSLLDEKYFSVYWVLTKDREIRMIKNYALLKLSSAISRGDETSFDNVKKKFTGYEAELMLESFFDLGGYEGLDKDDVINLYTDALNNSDNRSVSAINEYVLESYMRSIVIDRNNKNSKLELIAIYFLMDTKMNEMEKYIPKMISNGFKFDIFEEEVRNINKSDNISVFKSKLNLIFKNWIKSQN